MYAQISVFDVASDGREAINSFIEGGTSSVLGGFDAVD